MFGGNKEKRQISRVDGCGLKRVGSLAFDFYKGACTTVNDDLLVLCFPYNDGKRCHKTNNPDSAFTQMASTRYKHLLTRIASVNGKFY